MASETATGVRQDTENYWFSGAIGGLVGGVVFGALMQMQMPMIMETAIPAMYGLEGLTSGWVLHLFHSVVFGLLYAAVARTDAIAPYAGRVATGAGVGVAYGLVVWVVAASVVMPAWVGAMTPMSPPVPDFNPMSAVGHAVFGIVLGALYAALGDRF